eukprot:3552248-Prymnesium_polylepis.1
MHGICMCYTKPHCRGFEQITDIYGQKYRRDRGHLSHRHATSKRFESCTRGSSAGAPIRVSRAALHVCSTRRCPRLADPARHAAAVQEHEKRCAK